MAEDPSHMNDVCKDLVEEVIECEKPGELVQSAIDACKGRTEEVNAPAAYHQFPCNAEPIHDKCGARRGFAWHETLEQPRHTHLRGKQSVPWSTTTPQDDNEDNSCGNVDL